MRPETPSTPKPDVGSFIGATITWSCVASAAATPVSPVHALMSAATATGTGLAVKEHVDGFVPLPTESEKLLPMAMLTPGSAFPVFNETVMRSPGFSDAGYVEPD